MLYGYPQPGKDKSLRLLTAFCEGAGGRVARYLEQTEGCRSMAFYGTVGIERIFRMAQVAGDWFYLDNAYFDCAREKYFRVSRNAFQRALRPDHARLEQLDVRIAPWRRGGRHILVVEQSDYFMRELAGYPIEKWRADIRRTLGLHTDRPILVRPWINNKLKGAATLQRDFVDCFAVVTHASAAAVEAVLAGIPVFLTGESVALEMGLSQLERIESPRRPDGRREWAARLAASQWSEAEMRSGAAWNALKEEGN